MKKLLYIFSLVLICFLFKSNTIKAQTCGTSTISFISEYQVSSPIAPQTPIADRLGRPYLYVAAKDGGLLVFDINNINAPLLVKTININLFDTLHVMNIHQKGNLLYVALGNFFGSVGSSVVQKPGIAIIDISNPPLAFITDKWEYSVKERGASFVTVQGNYAYLSAMHKGIMIFDISNPNNIQFISEYQPNLNWPISSPTAAQTPNARGMAVRGDSIFLCYDAGGLRIINVSNKNAPIQVAQYINNGAISKQQAYNNIELNGNLAYIAEDYCGLEIINISNISTITQTGWWNPYHCESFSNWWVNSPGHANQIHYSQADNVVFLSMGGSQLRIVDVSNPASPDSCNRYGISGDGNGSWGVDFYNNTFYLANFIAGIPYVSNWAGVKILNWQPSVGVNELNTAESNNAYPNPFSEFVTINLNSNSNSKIEITDLTGRIIYNSMLINSKIWNWDGVDMNGNQIKAGIYFVKIMQPKKITITKIIKL